MKKVISMLGIAGVMCLLPFCKKVDIRPHDPNPPAPVAKAQKEMDTAKLYVTLASKPCATPQTQYTSASVDIRGIRVFNTERGWESLTPVPGAWDVVSLQSAPVPIAEITENSTVHTGTITKIELTFGDNNKLVVNDQAARCYKIGTDKVVLDMQGEIHAGSLNQIVVSIDICGNISVDTKYDQDPCYILNPVMAFETFTTLNTAQ